MHGRCVIAEYDSAEQARVGLEVLEKSGFNTETVSVVTRRHKETVDELAHLDEDAEEVHPEPADEDVPEETPTGLGMLLGGGLAAPLAAFTMIGPFMLAGPIAGIAAGGAVGRILGGTKRWGVHESAREAYERRVQEGAVLVMVHDEAMRLDEAETLLSTTHPRRLDRFAYSEQGT